MMSTEPVKLSARILGALAAIVGLVPTVGAEFGWIDWTAGQVGAYSLATGTFIGALALVLGVQVAKVVTPTARPRDDMGNPLTPGPVGGTDPSQLPPI